MASHSPYEQAADCRQAKESGYTHEAEDLLLMQDGGPWVSGDWGWRLAVAIVTSRVPGWRRSSSTGPGGRSAWAGPARWWRAWRARFGLAEACGTTGAVAGFAAGYLPAGSLLAGAALATTGEAIGFYSCLAIKAGLAAWRATAHLAGPGRLAATAWHAGREQLASCAAAEALDCLLIRPGCLAGAAWLARPLPDGVWLGLAAGKAAADTAWYAMEATARRPRPAGWCMR